MATATEHIIDAEIEELLHEPDALQRVEAAEQHATEQMALLRPQDYESLVMPGMSLEKMKERATMIEALVTTLLTKDVHYGKIPGTQETSLWKRGAVVFKTFFGFDVQFECLAQERDRGAIDQDGVHFPFIYYAYKAVLYRNGQRIGEYEASANSYEPCFRFVWVQAPKPKDQTEIDNMLAEGTGKFIKKWDDDLRESVPRWHVRRDHPNILSQDNSIRQRAEKRAMVQVIDQAVSASAHLVKQDMENKPNNSFRGGGSSKAKSLPQQFWDRARATSFMPEAAPIAEKAKKGEITWEQALAQLPPEN